MAEKNYISGILIKEVGEYKQLSISIKLEDFIEQLENIENNGWANIMIVKNRNPTDKGYTHHCFENTWKPNRREEPEEEIPSTQSEPELPETNDDLPF